MVLTADDRIIGEIKSREKRHRTRKPREGGHESHRTCRMKND